MAIYVHFLPSTTHWADVGEIRLSMDVVNQCGLVSASNIWSLPAIIASYLGLHKYMDSKSRMNECGMLFCIIHC